MSERKPARARKARSSSKASSKAARSDQHQRRANSKQTRVLSLLRRPGGATIATIIATALGAGFFTVVVRKKLAPRLESKKAIGSGCIGSLPARLPPMPRVISRARSHAPAADTYSTMSRDAEAELRRSSAVYSPMVCRSRQPAASACHRGEGRRPRSRWVYRRGNRTQGRKPNRGDFVKRAALRGATIRRRANATPSVATVKGDRNNA